MLTYPLRYDNMADVSRRLQNTIVLYQARPVIVISCLENLNVQAVDVLDPKFSEDHPHDHTLIFHSSDIELDLESPPLGWAQIRTNKGDRPEFFLRSISRQYSQGIDLRRIFIFDPMLGEDSPLVHGFNWRNWSTLVPIFLMIRGQDNQIMDAASKKGGPINRKWALVATASPTIFTVYHEANGIGTFDKDKQMFYFARGLLTKTRRMELDNIRSNVLNRGSYYGVQEQD